MMKTLLLIFLLLSSQVIAAQETVFNAGHTHDILAVTFSPDDSQLISYSWGDGRLILWEVKSGKLLWYAQTSFVQKADERYNLQEFYWSEDRKFIVTRSENGTFQTWDARTGKILSRDEVKPGIPLLAPNKKTVSVTKDYTQMTIADPETREVKTIKRFGFNPAYAVSNRGTLLAEGGGWGDASIRVTEIRTGKSWWLSGHPGVVKTIAYSPDGNYLAVAGSDKIIYIFDAAKHRLAKTLAGHTRPINSLAFSPDGKRLLSSAEHDSLKVWNWREGTFLQDINPEEDNISVVQKIVFSPDGKYFLTMGDIGGFRLWDAQTLKPARSFKTKSSDGEMTVGYDELPVTGTVFSTDGKRILSAYQDATLRTWDVNRGKQINRFKIGKNPSLVQTSPDDKTFLAAVAEGEDSELQIKLFDAQTGKVIFNFDDEETGYIETLTLSPDGKHFATSDVSGDVFIWSVNEAKPLRELEIGFSGSDAIAFSPDGKTLAVGGRNQNLHLFDVATGNKLWQLIPSYQESELEIRLTKEKDQRRTVLNEAKFERDKQAEIETATYQKEVYITFEHYGEMRPFGSLRMGESGAPDKSRVKKTSADADAIWLRLHNDSLLPIKIPTQSMYPSDCFYQAGNGQKLFGLCADREISIWHGLEDKNGESLRYGFDFGSESVLLPKTSALFAVPRAILKEGNAIYFSFTFLKEMDADKFEDYGKEITLKFREADLPKEK